MSTPRRARTPAKTSDDEGLLEALVRASFAVMAVLNEVAADHDLSLTQLRALAILRDRQLGTTALADYLGLEKSTMSGLVDRAERRKLVQRAPHPEDGRAVAITLTREGRALGDAITREVLKKLEPLTRALDASSRERLQLLLEEMVERGVGAP